MPRLCVYIVPCSQFIISLLDPLLEAYKNATNHTSRCGKGGGVLLCRLCNAGTLDAFGFCSQFQTEGSLSRKRGAACGNCCHGDAGTWHAFEVLQPCLGGRKLV